MRDWIFVFALLTLLFASALAQETVFNVPSGDVLTRGKVYAELDAIYQHATDVASFTPRLVVGVGHRIEVGLNINGITTSGDSQTVLSPTAKWKVYEGSTNGWAFLVGDSVFLPVQNRTYDAGNYLYAEFVKTFKSGTRATFGGYDFTPHVVANAQRAGGQFAIEQPIGRQVTLAADWYTGDHASGYFTPGIVVKLTPKLTWYGSYQIGNSGLSQGNHQLLTEIGWNFN